jgi:peptide deformylase
VPSFRLPGIGCEPITLWGNPVLRETATPVTVFDKQIKRLVEQLFETMYAIETGVGLAANQIGRTERVFVFDCQDGIAGYVINPVIEPVGLEPQTGGEACLSLPGFGLETVRLANCNVRGQDIKGNEVRYEGEGLRARCFQHEVDHLNGRLYIDHHSDKVRTGLETEMRGAPWFGNDDMDPKSKAYRMYQDPD